MGDDRLSDPSPQSEVMVRASTYPTATELTQSRQSPSSSWPEVSAWPSHLLLADCLRPAIASGSSASTNSIVTNEYPSDGPAVSSDSPMATTDGSLGASTQLELQSHLLNLGEDNDDDSGVSLFVSLGRHDPSNCIPLPGNRADHLSSSDGESDIGEYCTSGLDDMLRFPMSSVWSSQHDLRGVASFEHNASAAVPSFGSELSFGNSTEDEEHSQPERMLDPSTWSRSIILHSAPLHVPGVTRSSNRNRRTPRTAPSMFPYPQRQTRLREPREQTAEEEE